jgi:hypothetical protein
MKGPSVRKPLILTAALIMVLLIPGSRAHWRSSAADALRIRDGHGPGHNGVQLVRTTHPHLERRSILRKSRVSHGCSHSLCLPYHFH